ncbi:UNVERIFIED_CONTAM: hypothetical protein FKN15_069348 [Acipenser sinensis]
MPPASVPSVPQSLSAWPLRASVPWCLRASVPQRLDAPCLGASPRHVNNMSKFHPCTSCGGVLPPPDKQLLCVQCLDIQHVSSAFCTILRVLNNLRSIPATDPAQQTRGALCGVGSPGLPLFHLPPSPSQSIPCTQDPAHRSRSRSKSPSRSSSRLFSLLRPVVALDVSEQDVAISKEEQDANSIVASWDGGSFPEEETEAQELTQGTCPSSEPFTVFPDILEEVQSSWHRLASVPNLLKQAAPLASLEGVGVLGLAEFPPVDSTIKALVRDPPARVLDMDKSTLLDAPVSPGHTFGPAVEETLHRSHREREPSQQVASMLPSRAPVQERRRRWRPPVTHCDPDGSNPRCTMW